jgi:hypothetical protein
LGPPGSAKIDQQITRLTPSLNDKTRLSNSLHPDKCATVDEGNNRVNMTWGPLAMTKPAAPSGPPLGTRLF